jgi:hypothetical protein
MKANLYWSESFDHGEDWFVIALNADEDIIKVCGGDMI